MSSRCSNAKAIRFALTTMLVCGAVHGHRAAAADAVRVCVDRANPVAALDLKIARAALGGKPNIVFFTGLGKGGDGLPISRFAAMLHEDCDLVMGFPVDTSEPKLPPRVIATRPYARTGFVLVRRASMPRRSIDELPMGSEVGISQLDTYAGLLFSSHHNLVMHVYPSGALMLRDLEGGHTRAAIGWQPSVESDLRGHFARASLRLEPIGGRHMSWDLVALAAADAGITARFNDGIRLLQVRGSLARLDAPFELPEAIAADPAPTSYAPARAARLIPALFTDAATGEAPTGPAAASRVRGRPPAVYTDAQAKSGSLAYYKNCSMCHGVMLDGQQGGYSGPALKGQEFADPSYDFHLKDIFNFVAKLMPAATPGSLSPEEDVQIMAFLLQQNGYPAGSHELTYDFAAKSSIPIRYYTK